MRVIDSSEGKQTKQPGTRQFLHQTASLVYDLHYATILSRSLPLSRHGANLAKHFRPYLANIVFTNFADEVQPPYQQVF